MLSLFKSNQGLDQTILQQQDSIDSYKAKFDAIDRAMAVIEFKPDGTILRANQNFLAAMAYKENQIIGKHHSIFCSPEYSHSQEYKELWLKLNSGEFFSGKVERINNKGESIWLQASYNPVFNQNGDLDYIVKFASDITERIKATQEQTAIIEAISRSMAIIEFNLDGTIITANDNFLNTVNYTLEQITGKHHKMFCEPSLTTSTEYQNFWNTLNSGSFCQGKFKRLNSNGEIIWLEATYQPIYDVKGKLAKVIKFATDVTNQTSAASQAQEMAYQTSMKTDKAVQRGTSVVEDSKQLMGNLSKINTETASTLQELNKQSDQINNIVNTISGIADQTNLLALNAAIEAARAGDQGRGFAVVADEVRQLAGRTSSSTSEIAEVVSKNLELAKEATTSMENSLLQVESGVELVENLSSTITQINESVRDVVESINQIGNDDMTNVQ